MTCDTNKKAFNEQVNKYKDFKCLPMIMRAVTPPANIYEYNGKPWKAEGREGTTERRDM